VLEHWSLNFDRKLFVWPDALSYCRNRLSTTQATFLRTRSLRIVSRLVDNNANLHFTPWGTRSVTIYALYIKKQTMFSSVFEVRVTLFVFILILIHSKTRGRDIAESPYAFVNKCKHLVADYRSFTIYINIIHRSIFSFGIISTYISWTTFEGKLQYANWPNWSYSMQRNLKFINILILLKIKIKS